MQNPLSLTEPSQFKKWDECGVGGFTLKNTEARLPQGLSGLNARVFLSFVHGRITFDQAQVIACVLVHSFAVWIAAGSSSFQR